MTKPRILAIAGGTASGKTTIAKAITDRLGDRAAHVTHDRYYKTLDRDIANHPNRVLLHNYDHPDALETELLVEHLTELRAGRSVRVPDYDFADSARRPEPSWVTIHPKPIIVVEGILILAHEELRALFDHIVFVDAPDDIRLARRMKRDIVERGQQPHEVIGQYLAAVRPMHEKFVATSKVHAHLVLDGTARIDAMTDRVWHLIHRDFPEK
jgi:uridine kinase